MLHSYRNIDENFAVVEKFLPLIMHSDTVAYKQNMILSLLGSELVRNTCEFVSTNWNLCVFFSYSPPVCLYL